MKTTQNVIESYANGKPPLHTMTQTTLTSSPTTSNDNSAFI